MSTQISPHTGSNSVEKTVSADSPACNVCGKIAFDTQYSYPDYDLLRCKACGLGMLFPVPQFDSEDYYDEDYYRGGLDQGIGFVVLDPENIKQSREGVSKKVDWLFARREITSFLDIGCGIGFFVEAMRQRGIEAVGVDISKFAVRFGHEELGIEGLKAGFFQDVLQPGEQYDVIYLHHVIEHVPDPKGFVHDCVSFLAPGGWLVMEAPDIDSAEAVRNGKDWIYILPEHLYYFNIPSLSGLAESQGLAVRYAEKEIGSPGLLNATFGNEDSAKAFYDKWLKNSAAQWCIRLFRKAYASVGQKVDVDYKFMKIVAEKVR